MGHRADASSSCSRQNGFAFRVGGRSSSDRSGSRERTSTGALTLFLVIQVQHKGQLLFGRAERVGAVLAGSSVGSDAAAVNDVADVAEQVRVVFFGNLVGNNAFERRGHAVADTLVRSRRQARSSFPVRKRGSWACTGVGVCGGEGSRVDARRLDAVDLGGVGVVVSKSLDRVGLNGNNAVVVGFFKVHVQNTTRPDVGHVGAVERRHVSKNTGLGIVASVLGKEDRHSIVLKLLGTVGVARGLEVDSVAAPLVDVDTVEVGSRRLVAAVEVVGKVITGISIVVGSIANRNRTVVFSLDVGLDITDSSLDKGRGVGVGVVVGNLVTSKEAKDVGVASQSVNNGGIALEKVDGPGRRVSVDGKTRLGEIGNDVDAVLGKQVDAVVVVLGSVDGIDAQHVSFETQQVGQVTFASGAVGQRIAESGVGRSIGEFLLVSNALHEELCAIV